jgi:hypothetical protein
VRQRIAPAPASLADAAVAAATNPFAAANMIFVKYWCAARAALLRCACMALT